MDPFLRRRTNTGVPENLHCCIFSGSCCHPLPELLHVTRAFVSQVLQNINLVKGRKVPLRGNSASEGRASGSRKLQPEKSETKHSFVVKDRLWEKDEASASGPGSKGSFSCFASSPQVSLISSIITFCRSWFLGSWALGCQAVVHFTTQGNNLSRQGWNGYKFSST